jgi:hypothetical protein
MNDQQIENLQVSFVLAVSCLDMSFFQATNEMPFWESKIAVESYVISNPGESCNY